jgi:hypothetical protein
MGTLALQPDPGALECFKGEARGGGGGGAFGQLPIARAGGAFQYKAGRISSAWTSRRTEKPSSIDS